MSICSCGFPRCAVEGFRLDSSPRYAYFASLPRLLAFLNEDGGFLHQRNDPGKDGDALERCRALFGIETCDAEAILEPT